jgi:predicted nucleic acid-binding protein
MSDRYWDSGCFLALFNNEAGRVDNCKSVLMAAERGELRIITSALTLTEVIKIKGKPIGVDQEDHIRAFFEHEWILVRDVDRFIAEQAREFIWKHKLQPYDAIHLATAYKHKLQHLDTYDGKDLGKLSGKIGVPGMTIGEPPVIPYQTELPAIEPSEKKPAKKRPAAPKKPKSK